jgi:2-succinyl-5-enolpyruvyl-6-hydroxy-3-cyclohexene-1-carboxylate synthase
MTLDALPSNSELHMGNSSVVRYIQLFQPLPSVTYRGNRGVSGIDGCTSTALGAATVSLKPVTLISGDLSFLYDMNAIWQAPWPPHFKVVIINNGGGGIFKIIDGAKDEPYHEQYFETPQQEVDLVKWASAFGKMAVSVSTEQALLEVLPRFFYAEGPQLLEIKTERLMNPVVLQRYFAAFKF